MATFTLVTPDAMLGGYLRLVLDRLQAHGLAVRAHRLLELNWHLMGQLYSHQDDPPPTTAEGPGQLPQRVMERLYRLAPAAVLILDGTAEQMLACKGATFPDQAAPGTIRAAGEHATFNFVHCPDDEASAKLELAYLVGREEAAALMAHPGMWLDQLHMCVPAYSGWEAISFPMVANRLRCRLVQRVGAPAAHDLLFTERQLLLRSRSAADRLQIGQQASPAIHAALRVGDPGLQAGLEALAALFVPGASRDQAPIVALQDRGIYLSELEQVTLAAHAHTFL